MPPLIVAVTTTPKGTIVQTYHMYKKGNLWVIENKAYLDKNNNGNLDNKDQIVTGYTPGAGCNKYVSSIGKQKVCVRSIAAADINAFTKTIEKHFRLGKYVRRTASKSVRSAASGSCTLGTSSQTMVRRLGRFSPPFKLTTRQKTFGYLYDSYTTRKLKSFDPSKCQRASARTTLKHGSYYINATMDIGISRRAMLDGIMKVLGLKNDVRKPDITYRFNHVEFNHIDLRRQKAGSLQRIRLLRSQ